MSEELPAAAPPAATRRLARALAPGVLAPDPAGWGGPDPAGDEPGSVGPDQGGPDPVGTLARLGGAAAFDPGRPGIRALATVAVAVVIIAAGIAWWSRPRAEPVTAPLTSVTAPAQQSAPTAPADLVVAVSGLVREPGLVQLPPGARVADAIEAAGGVLPEADLDHLNLARRVSDGELITVGIPPPLGEAAAPGELPGAAGRVPVNLNTASQAELDTLPGIGPALAQRIIDFRTAQGPFTAVDQLRQVSGIGEVRFAELRDLVTV